MNRGILRLATTSIALESVAITALLCRPLLTGQLIDVALHGQDAVILSWLVLALLATWVVRAGQLPSRDRVLGRISNMLHLRLRSRVLGTVLETRGTAPDRSPEATLIAEQTPRLVLDACSTMVRMTVGSCLLAYIHPDLLFAILPVMLAGLVMAWKGQPAGASAAVAVAQARALERTGWDEIIATRGSWTPPGWEDWMAANVATRAEHRGRQEYHAALTSGWWQPAMAMAATVGVILLLLVGSGRIATGELSAGDLAAAIFLVFLVIGPILDLAGNADRWTAIMVAWRRVDKPRPLEQPPTYHDCLAWTELAIDWPLGAHLHLPGGALARGGRLLIRGSSGSGKSSLLRCLAGSIQPTRGSVDFGMRTVLIEHCQVLPPWSIDAFLIAAASAGTAMDIHEIRAIAVELGIDAMIADQPGGYAGRADRMIGTPAGQAIAMLAGRVSDSALLLDEATSLMPAGLAKRIMATLVDHGSTMVVAAHRRTGMDEWPILELGRSAYGV